MNLHTLQFAVVAASTAAAPAPAPTAAPADVVAAVIWRLAALFAYLRRHIFDFVGSTCP